MTSDVRETRLVPLFLAGLAARAAGVAATARRPREEVVGRRLVLSAAKRLSSFQLETVAEVEDA